MEAKQINFSDYVDKRVPKSSKKGDTTLIADETIQKEAMDKLWECQNYYNALRDFRDERKRARDFYTGEQWNDLVEDPDTGEFITEATHIANQGKIPLKQNQVRQVIKNLLGQFRDSDNTSTVVSRNRENAKGGEMLTNALHYNLQANQVKELDVRAFEEFLISGSVFWRSYYGMHEERNIDDVIIDNPHPTRMFFNTGLTDIRGKEIHTIGELHDVMIEDIIAQFAENEADEEKIRGWYGKRGERRANRMAREQDEDIIDNIDFFVANDDKCRVIEIWEKKLTRLVMVHDKMDADYYETDESLEEVEQRNAKRMMAAIQQGVTEEDYLESLAIEANEEYHEVWYYWYLTPNGDILRHDKTPYAHESSPYTVGLYPLIDGKIFGLVHDIIDQQKNVNRLITLMDFIIGASAKGVLLFPESMLPKGWDMEDVAAEWTAYNGVIAYKPDPKNPTAMPKQIVSNSRNAGVMDMLQMQLMLLEKISGVNDAIQGHKPASGTPSSLYAQQTHNASLSNKDFFEFFFSKKKIRDFKVVKLIQQYYDDHRYIAVGGKDFDEDKAYYDPVLAKDLEFEMSMSQISSTTLYRQILDDHLMKFLELGAITFDEFLETTSMPFADKLKESRERTQRELEQRMANGEQVDPETMAMMQQMMGA